MGGPEKVSWDTFIHPERRRLSDRPPSTASVPPRTTPIPTLTSPKPQTTASLPARTTPIPSLSSSIPQTTPPISPIMLSNPLTPPILSVTPKITNISPIKPHTTHSMPHTSTPKPKTSREITLPTSTVTLPAHESPFPSIKPQTSVSAPLTPQVFSITSKALSGPIETSPELLSPAPPGPTMTPLVPPQRKELQDTKVFNSAAPTPVPPPPPPVRSQVSIDSDSDMMESSGLLQEVSILPPQKPRPPIISIIGGPGSGKGSQAARLASCFSFKVISLDELLRRQLLSHTSPSRKWEVISQMMGHGEMGPRVRVNQRKTLNHPPQQDFTEPAVLLCLKDETILELRRQLTEQQEARGFIVDGFPQDIHQALSFQEQVLT
ncbi:proline-rich protein 36-like isoform X4 [Pseudoliparis swirei]|uniref:proline-rich protein 36-like isoform X4 n=1 Tax=Pseudoliparis swirei TaxID=2059687 RepID=UPI0024BE4C63|nr:proline-rich protein 36-like isoform X4 [Pseudoliparis swirei]